MTWKPLHFFAVAIDGWMNRQRQEAISYLKEKNRISIRKTPSAYEAHSGPAICSPHLIGV